MTTPSRSVTGTIARKRVTIGSIETDSKTAIVTDSFGRTMQIPYTLMRAKGVYPAVGESWIVDYSLGFWSFAAIIDGPPLTGGTGGGGGGYLFAQDQFTVNTDLGRSFALSHVPISGSATVALNGINLTGLGNLDYSITGSTLTVSPSVNIVATDVISASYSYAGS